MLVTFTATDDCGLFVTTTAAITIEDTAAPTITQEATNEVVECDGLGNLDQLQSWLDNNGSATAEDGCSDVTWTNDYTNISDDCGATGATLVVFTATDDCGNTSTVEATFTIEDTTAPEILGVGEAFTLECNQEIIFSEPTTSDECGTVTLEFEDFTDGSICTGFTRTRTWTATDECQNQTQATQVVTVNCSEPEDISNELSICAQELPFAWTSDIAETTELTAAGTYDRVLADDNGCEYEEVLTLLSLIHI